MRRFQSNLAILNIMLVHMFIVVPLPNNIASIFFSHKLKYYVRLQK